MQVQNSEIAEKFNHLADLLEIEGANLFRIRAYRNAARTLLGSSESIADLVHEDSDLTDAPKGDHASD
jgi:DNA polymerase (family 10)